MGEQSPIFFGCFYKTIEIINPFTLTSFLGKSFETTKKERAFPIIVIAIKAN